MCCRRRNRTPLVITAATLVAKKIADHRETRSIARNQQSTDNVYPQEVGISYPEEQPQYLGQAQPQTNEDQPPQYTENDDNNNNNSNNSSLTATPVGTRSIDTPSHVYHNNESRYIHTNHCRQPSCAGQCVANHQNLSNCQIHKLERQARWMERKELKAQEKELRLLEKMARKEEKVFRKVERR